MPGIGHMPAAGDMVLAADWRTVAAVAAGRLLVSRPALPGRLVRTRHGRWAWTRLGPARAGRTGRTGQAGGGRTADRVAVRRPELARWSVAGLRIWIRHLPIVVSRPGRSHHGPPRRAVSRDRMPF